MDNYLSIAEEVKRNGLKKDSRAGTVVSDFGYKREYDLTEGYPLVTTKKMWFNGIVDELLWFISGSTNVNDLKPKVQKIWKPWARDNGELGPIYGKQLRDWNGYYDQLQEVIDGLKENPLSRRHCLTAWNAPMLQHAELYPCHMALVQFYVEDAEYYTETPKLSMSMYQRSADVALGLPWNIASYSLLLHMVANVTGYKVGTFIHHLGDTHIYWNHMKGIKEQLTRTPLEKPTIELADKDSIDDYERDDFTLKDYVHHPKIDFKINV